MTPTDDIDASLEYHQSMVRPGAFVLQLGEAIPLVRLAVVRLDLADGRAPTPAPHRKQNPMGDPWAQQGVRVNFVSAKV
jgi:hypothetical protein